MKLSLKKQNENWSKFYSKLEQKDEKLVEWFGGERLKKDYKGVN